MNDAAELVAYLTARYDEKEGVARAASRRPPADDRPVTVDMPGLSATIRTGHPAPREPAADDSSGEWRLREHEHDYHLITDSDGCVVVYDEGSPTEEQAAHMVLNHPASVLADIASKRKTLADCERAASGPDHDYGDTGPGLAEDVLMDLVSAFEGRPDYPPKWTAEVRFHAEHGTEGCRRLGCVRKES